VGGDRRRHPHPGWTSEEFIGTDQDITDRRRADAERRRLLGRVYEAQEGQDRRLAADLHDGHVQSLAAIGFKLEAALGGRFRMPTAPGRGTVIEASLPLTDPTERWGA
jgi:signal transduction histidine kinase